MSTVVGQGIIEVSADSTKLEAGIAEAKRSVRSLGDANQSAAARSAAAIDTYIKRLEASASSIGKTTRELKLQELAQRGATAEQLRSADAALSTIEAYKKQQAEARKAAAAATAAAAASAAAATRQANATRLSANEAQILGVQVKDFFQSVISGASPVQAFAQQGATSISVLGGFSSAMQKLGSIFTATRVLAGGAAVAVAGLALALNEGHEQSLAFAKAMALTGNAAGVTEGQLNAMAKQVSDSTKTTIGAAREALQGLVATGKFGGEALQETARATLLYSKVTGQSTDDVRKSFGGMADGVAAWAEATNRSYHFLTATQLRYIKTLEEQGSHQQAIDVLMKALNVRLAEAAKNLGYVEKAWSGVKSVASAAIDTMLGWGRVKTPEGDVEALAAKIEATQNKINRLKKLGPQRDALVQIENLERILRSDQQHLQILQSKASVQQKAAEAQGQEVERQAAGIAFDKLKEQSLTRQKRFAKEIADANALADKAGASPADRKDVIDAIKEKYKDLDLGQVTLALNIAKIKSNLETLTGIYRSSESILEATHAAGLIDEKTYYEAKREFLNLETDAQAKALQDEIKLLQARKLTGKEAIENQKQIAEARGKLSALNSEAAAKSIVISTQEKNAIDQVARAYEMARQSAQEFLDTQTRQQGRELAGFGLGNKERSRLAARQQIEDRYQQQRLDLENNKRLLEMEKDPNGNSKFTSDAREKYQGQLAIINDFQARALEGWDAYYTGIQEKESSWLVGANEALANYKANAENVAGNISSAFSTAYDGLTDGIASSVTKSLLHGASLKEGLREVAYSIADAFITSFIKIQIQQLLIDKATEGAFAGTIAAQSQAMVAMAGLNAFASTAAIPIVGPVLAPEAAAAAIAAAEIMATTATVAASLSVLSARGGMDIPAGVNPLTQLHEKEMVLPAQHAQVIRDLANTGGGSSGDIKVTIVNNGTPQRVVQTQRISDREIALITENAISGVAAEMSDPNSRTSRALGRNYQLQRSR